MLIKTKPRSKKERGFLSDVTLTRLDILNECLVANNKPHIEEKRC